MIRYRKPDGTTFVLAYHDPAEWAYKVGARLLDLGCDEEYVRRVVDAYASAVKP